MFPSGIAVAVFCEETVFKLPLFEKIYIMIVAINIKISCIIRQSMSVGVDAALVEKHPQLMLNPRAYAWVSPIMNKNSKVAIIAEFALVHKPRIKNNPDNSSITGKMIAIKFTDHNGNN